jgi:hypothetical protein
MLGCLPPSQGLSLSDERCGWLAGRARLTSTEDRPFAGRFSVYSTRPLLLRRG